MRPSPPALNIFDAGMGDGTVLSRLMRYAHSLLPGGAAWWRWPRRSASEDVRLGLDKMPDRFTEHPATVLVITNLNYADAPRLLLRDTQLAAALNWQEIRLTGDSAHAYEEQIEEVSDTLADAWSTHPSEKTGNPVYRRPSVLVVYREDHKFLLDNVIPRPGRPPPHYDLILASQPWRARMSAEFKASRVLAPLTRALAPRWPVARHPVRRRRSGAGDHPEAVAGREPVPGGPACAARGAENRAGPRCACLQPHRASG